MVAAPRPHPLVECRQRARTALRLPRGITPAALGDPSVMGRPGAGLPDARVEAEIGDKLVRGGKLKTLRGLTPTKPALIAEFESTTRSAHKGNIII